MASSNTHSDSETNPSPVHFSGGYSKSVEERVFVGESSDDVSPVVESTRGGDDVHRSAEEARDANIGGNDEEERCRSINFRDYGLEVVSDSIPFFPARVTVRSSWEVFKKIKLFLAGESRLTGRFRSCCFGHFAELGDGWSKGFWGQAAHYMLLHSVKSNKKNEIWFVVDRKPIRFGMMEFALVSGLNCGAFPEASEVERLRNSKAAKTFLTKVLARKQTIVARDLEVRIKDEGNKYTSEEKFRMCLIWFVHSILMASDSAKTVNLDWVCFASDENFFNAYPWGRLAFQLTIDSLRGKDMASKHRLYTEKDKPSTYNLLGFPWALQAWLYEAIPVLAKVGGRKETMDDAPQYPRMLRWHIEKSLHWDYDKIESEIEIAGGVVRPFITPTRGELEADYVTSFVPLDDVVDDGIDRLMRDLDGVTHLSAPVGPFVDSVFEADVEKGGMDEDEHMEVEVRTPPPTWQGGRTNTDLPTDREKKLVDLISELNSKFDSLSKTVYERFDKVEERLQQVEDKVDMVFKIVDVGAQKRETRRSKHVKSPFTEIRYGKKRTKIVRKKVREGGDGAMVDKEEVGRGGEVETKKLGVDLYRPMDEEKKKIFYAYFNDKGNDDCVKCTTGDYSREWFDRLLRMGFWLEDSHIDEVLTLMRLRQSSHSHVFDQHCAITDVLFGQQLLGIYESLQGKAGIGVATRGGKRKRMSEEELDGVIAEYRFDDRMLQYVRGERPKHGKSWANVKKVYCVINIKQMHWVTVVWLLEEGLLEILDCNPSICRDSELQMVMHPLCKLFPRLLRDSGMFDHLGDELLTRTWRHYRVPAPTNDASADCGVYAIKFLEFNMTNTPMDNLNDKTLIDFRERLAVECFHGEMDPCVVSEAA